MAIRAIDTVKRELLPLIDPWLTPTPYDSQWQRGPALQPAYRTRQAVGAQVRREGLEALFALPLLAIMAFTGSGNPQSKVDIIWLTLGLAAFTILLAIVNYYTSRAAWARSYRETYYALCRNSLALRIAEPAFWRCFLYPEDHPPGGHYDAVPESVDRLLRRATFELDSLQRYANYEEQPLIEMKLERALGASDLPSKYTQTNARYAAIYDFFFEEQRAFMTALTDAEAAEDALEEVLDAGLVGI